MKTKSVRVVSFVLATILATGLGLPAPAAAATCPAVKWGAFSQATAPVTFQSDPVLGQNDDGHLEVFAIGSDGALWHSWQMNDFVTWSPWSSFGLPPGDQLQPGHHGLSVGPSAVPVLSVALGHAGTLQVFAVGAKGIWQIGQVVRNANWGGWARVPPSAPPAKPIGVWAIANEDSRIELFTADLSTGAPLLSHTWQLGDFKTWFNGLVSFNQSGTLAVANVAMARDLDNRIVVASTFQGMAFVRRQSVMNAGWEDWQPIGTPPSGQIDLGTAQLAVNADRRLELLVSSGNGLAYWHSWQSNADAWSGFWGGFGLPAGAIGGLDSSFVQGLDGCINLLSLVGPSASGFSLAFLTQKQPSIDWSAWNTQASSMPDRPGGHMAVARRHDGLLELFVLGQGGHLFHAVQSSH
ncbi:MAG TPA: hypothetical protein VFI23_11765 [Rhizomicrobium sp.]|nr:hypothetical protein [Rhizomicrobium sp.]